MKKLLLFPAHLGTGRARLLAYLEQNQITTENEQTYQLCNVGELASLLLQENLLLFVGSLGKLPAGSLDYLIDHSRVWSSKRGDPVSAQFIYSGKKTRWLASCKSWGYNKPSLDFLRQIRAFFDVLDMGVSTGPGGAGLALLRTSWKREFGLNWKRHRHQRPTQACCNELGERGMGARSDCLTTETFDWAWELDRKNAYGADFSEPMPTGPVTRFLFGLVEDYQIWFGECEVTIPEDLCYGLFPMRDGEGQLYYPTRKGTYTTWMSSYKAAMCQRNGLLVEPQEGWGWYETTTDQALFVQEMEVLRDAHPEIGDLIKLSLVAAIGRLGMDNTRYYLSREGNDETDVRVAFDKRASDYFLKQEIDYKPQSMPHWYWYVQEIASTKLTEEGYQWAKKEMLIGTNTDAVILKPEARTSKYPSKSDSQMVKSGHWRARKLLKVTIPALRHLTATTENGEQIDTRPGVPHTRRS